ncbi:MAG TPA: archaellin/type IV pilin N-terminal domain-containing protein, partial [Thermoplasmata archaeon]|nr:archaellin/type IV pilin N-terminal domain-containing protein [Thermoplasmata archaeon]
MSAKAKRIERSQRFKRAWRGENRKKAVSPVVATLILILIAVAAAAALYLWLVAWQGGVTGGIGNPSAQYTVSIGGSTSVYPFAEIAATQFEQNNSDVV